MLVSGTAGMSLASVIRLEFAYPGVGVLAGDSLQYLSVATAHGVIMVFYMIMPAIFGAFGNFLLPTQLGVHDVAFPRLNSAAFWFLPGGLIMLAQLVCTDRRYARMNCFNIRELQSILKNKFFTDLINSHEHKDLLNRSMIGLRFKANNTFNTDLDMNLFYNFGLHTTSVMKHYHYGSNDTTTSFWASLNVYIFRNSFLFGHLNSLNTYFVYIIHYLYDMITFPTCIFTLVSFPTLVALVNCVKFNIIITILSLNI